MHGGLPTQEQRGAPCRWQDIATDRLPWSTSADPVQKSEKAAKTRRSAHLQRILGTVVYIIKVVHHKCHAFVEIALVEPVQVSKMNLEPTQTTFAERFCFCEH
jgi:hypothetical protein